MFQDGSDGVPANSPQTLCTLKGSSPGTQARRAVRTHCKQSVQVDQLREGPGVPALRRVRLQRIPQPSSQPTPSPSVTLPPEGESYLPGWLKAAERAGRGALPAESAPANGRHPGKARPLSEIRHPPRVTVQPAEFRRVDFCGPIRLPLSGFTYSLTLSSKYFSTFPHGTCWLSVSQRYLALDGVYHLLWAAFPNNPTLRTLRGTAAATLEA